VVRHVGQVGSQSRPNMSVGVSKITLCKPRKVSKGLRPMGSNAKLGKECVGIGKTWLSHFDLRALLVFVCTAKSQLRMVVSDWEFTERGFRRSKMNGFAGSSRIV